MARFLVLAQSEVTAHALGAWLERLAVEKVYGPDAAPPPIVFDPSAVNTGEELAAIRSLARRFEAASGVGERSIISSRTVVLVDSIDPQAMNPLAEGGGWDSVVAQLILAFPEAHWVFGVVRSSGGVGNRGEKNSVAFPKSEHCLEALATLPAVQPLFDGSGLRQWVKGRALATLKAETRGHHLPSRQTLALATDDEPSYAYFYAYAAYRFGYRARVVDTEAEFVRLLGEEGSAKEDDLALSLEDLFLNFPDRMQDRGLDGQLVHWSDLAQRNETLPLLNELRPLRVFITTGHRKGSALARRRRNREISGALRRKGLLGTVVRKPLAGVFDLWERSGLRKALACKKNPLGHAKGFVWPPHDDDGNEEGGGSHSAPGRLLEIAGWLLERAEGYFAEVRSVPDAVQGAVLATEALELLGYKTPTTALEALSLRHAFEVTAECQFHGVVAHLDVRSRVEDLRSEIDALSNYFAPEERRLSCWSAESAILGRLIRIFREHEQFDEEMELQIRNRRLHRRMWFKGQRWWGALGDQLRWLNPAYWAVRYAHFLVDSVPRFLLCIMLWVLLLALLRGTYLSFAVQLTEPPTFAANFADSLSAFLGGNAPSHEANKVPSHPLYVTMVAIATIGGVLHFGILLSHLYALVSRR